MDDSKNKGTATHSIWVFGDYRNYFQNRVTLQLLSRANELAKKINAEVCATVFGHDVDEWVGEYIAHGAQKIYVLDDRKIKDYNVDIYAGLMVRLIEQHKPEIVLVGATSFGREFAPQVAKKLLTGLTADCVGLDINDKGILLQTAPAFGGNLLAEIITPERRPQMATVRPGVYREIPHNYHATGEIVRLSLPKDLPKPRVRLLSAERQTQREQRLEDARIIVCGGRGMGSFKRFRNLTELARLMSGEVGATRPVVYAKWASQDALVGQAGRQIKPQLLFSFGISGAIQHTAAITGTDLIIAVNKNPNAAMMKLSDVAIVADANQTCLALIKELKKSLRG